MSESRATSDIKDLVATLQRTENELYEFRIAFTLWTERDKEAREDLAVTLRGIRTAIENMTPAKREGHERG